jgi:hypothetical protein
MERPAGEIRELTAVAQGHRSRRKLDAAVDKLSRTKGCVVASVFYRHGAIGPPPRADFCDHDSSPHIRFPVVFARTRRPDARCGDAGRA